MIGPCIEPGCSTLCMGLFCVKHDARPQVDFPRGRPWPAAPRAREASVAGVAFPALAEAAEPALTTVTPVA